MVSILVFAVIWDSTLTVGLAPKKDLTVSCFLHLHNSCMLNELNEWLVSILDRINISTIPSVGWDSRFCRLLRHTVHIHAKTFV